MFHDLTKCFELTAKSILNKVFSQHHTNLGNGGELSLMGNRFPVWKMKIETHEMFLLEERTLFRRKSILVRTTR